MLFLVLASAFLVTGHGQAPNPTKVCLPSIFQIQDVPLTGQPVTLFAYNFPEKIIAVKLNGTRTVFNLTYNTLSVQTGANSECTKMPNSDKQTFLYGPLKQCLPANAKLVTSNNTNLDSGLASPDLQVWEIALPLYGTVRIALTKTSPAVPVLIQSINSTVQSKPPSTQQMYLLVNAKPYIDDYSVFDLPANCTEKMEKLKLKAVS